MALGDLFKKNYKYIDISPKSEEEKKEFAEKYLPPSIPDDLLVQCPSCKAKLIREELEEADLVCSQCGHHFRMGVRSRLALTADEGSFRETNGSLTSLNALDYPGYEKKLEQAGEKSGEKEAVLTGACTIGGHPAVLAIMDSNFIMGSMGSVVGEKITRAIEQARAEKLPLIIFTASGGARMQEGILSLMQMAKTSAALERFSRDGGLYITVITDPTTGGVTASFAMLGDIIIGEQGALIGFAGKRVIEQTIRQKLPDDFQTVEFLQEHGFIDIIAKRGEIRDLLERILRLHQEVPHDN